MTELEARRHLLADPRHLSPELTAAIDTDPRLAQLRDDLLRNDAAMQAALTEAPVPEGLADRLVLHARYGRRSHWGLALAAGVAALAVAVPGYFGLRDHETEVARDEAIIHHVVGEKGELADNGNVAPAVFRASVTAFGVPVRDPAYRVRHLANCIVAGIESRHFVLEGPRGPISYIILPGAKDGDGEERMLDLGPMRGLFTRRAGFTIGVVGEASMDRTELEQMMRAVL